MRSFIEFHPHEKGFSAYYEQHLAPLYEELNEDRASFLRTFWLAGLVAVPACLFLGWLGIGHANAGGKNGDGFLMLIGFVLAAWGWVYYRGINKLKNTAGSKVIGFFGPDFSYQADKFLSGRDLCVDSTNITGSGGEDEIEGKHSDVAFRLSEVKFESGHGKSRHTIFKGLFLDLTFPQALFGRTLLAPGGGFFSSLGKLRPSFNGTKEILLEDPVFKDKFKVYGDDQVQARVLLSPAFMDRLLVFAALGSKLGMKQIRPGDGRSAEEIRRSLPKKNVPHCIFNRDRLQVLIPCDADLFELGSLFKPFPDMVSLRRTLYQIHMVFELIDAVNPAHMQRMTGGAEGQAPPPESPVPEAPAAEASPSPFRRFTGG